MQGSGDDPGVVRVNELCGLSGTAEHSHAAEGVPYDEPPEPGPLSSLHLWAGKGRRGDAIVVIIVVAIIVVCCPVVPIERIGPLRGSRRHVRCGAGLGAMCRKLIQYTVVKAVQATAKGGLAMLLRGRRHQDADIQPGRRVPPRDTGHGRGVRAIGARRGGGTKRQGRWPTGSSRGGRSWEWHWRASSGLRCLRSRRCSPP